MSGALGESQMGSKILLADDSITIQKVVNLTFADEGIEVISVSNGDLAERRLKEVDPDLVLADIFMPGKNGYELCETIKQTPQFRDVPVVLLVGAFEPFNEAEARRVNADAHLIKPFESRVLVETVKHLIDKSAKPKSISTTTQAMGSEPAPQPVLPSARPFPLPAIDLSAMSAPNPPQESVFADRVPTGSLADPTPFADSFPANFDFGNQPSTAQPSQVDLLTGVNQAFTNEPQSFLQSPTPAEAADAAPTHHADVLNIDLFASPLNLEIQEPLTNHSGDFFDIPGIAAPAPVASEVLLAEVAQPSVEKMGEVVVDFEKVERSEEVAPAPLPAFEIATAPAASPESAATAEAKQFDTNELETPVKGSLGSPTGGLFIPAVNGASTNYTPDNKGFDFHTDTAAEHTASSLLSADEPLGDLLFNEFPQETYQQQVEEVAPLEFEAPVAATGEAFAEEIMATPTHTQGFIQDTAELPDQEAAHVEVRQPAAPDVTVTLSKPQQEEIAFTTQDAHQNAVGESASPSAAPVNNHGFDLLMPEKVEPVPVETTSSFVSEVNFYTEPAPNEMQEPLEPTVAAAPETAAGFDQALLQPETAAQEEKFTASDMWSAETQFTPVSIAPVPLADYPTTHTADTAETLVAEQASAPMPEYADSPSQAVAQTSPDAPQKDASHLEVTPQKGVEMNQEMIDEIVRRVVAQLSDTVVREIAWEVVPDCVERVVSTLTKEDLAKRI
jgi:CheY-like chemotaxis protein